MTLNEATGCLGSLLGVATGIIVASLLHFGWLGVGLGVVLGFFGCGWMGVALGRAVNRREAKKQQHCSPRPNP